MRIINVTVANTKVLFLVGGFFFARMLLAKILLLLQPIKRRIQLMLIFMDILPNIWAIVFMVVFMWAKAIRKFLIKMESVLIL